MIPTLSNLLLLARKITAVILATSIVALSIVALAQSPQNESSQGSDVVIPDGTDFDILTVDEISSKTASEGDALTFKVADDLKIGGRNLARKVETPI